MYQEGECMQIKLKELLKNGYVVELATGDRYIISQGDLFDDELWGTGSDVLSSYNDRLEDPTNKYLNIMKIFDTVGAMKNNNIIPIWSKY